MARKTVRLAVLVAAFVLQLASPLRALGGGPASRPRDPDAESQDAEVRERFEHLRARDRAAAERYGSHDLRDLYVRGFEAAKKERERARRRALDPDAPLAGTWTSLGPTVKTAFVQGGASPDNNEAGTLTAIAAHPTDPSTILVGTTGGGVWKTTDRGASWRLVTDDLGPLGILQIGALAIAPSNPNRVYAGTGAGDASTYRVGSPDFNLKTTIGVLVSDNGGEPGSWRRSGSSPADFFWALDVDPADANTLLAAGDQGLMRSTDAGDSWARVYPTEGPLLRVTSLVRVKSAPQTLFAGAWAQGQAAGVVVKSTDGGQTWAPKMNGMVGADDSRGRIQVAVAPSNGNRVYALVATQAGAQVDLARSNDGGESWSGLGLTDRGANVLGTQGQYANVLAVDPQNPDRVYAGGLDLWRSDDAGQSIVRISHWYQNDPKYLHADQHALVFAADGALYIGCDGGIFRQASDGSFTGLNRGIVSFMFSGICVGPDGSVLGGAQDNGPNRLMQGTEWATLATGDGFACLVHPQSPQRVVISVQNEAIYWATDGGLTPQGSEIGEAENQRVFQTRLVPHPTNPERVYTATRQRIWRSDDFGRTFANVAQDESIIADITAFHVAPTNGEKIVAVDRRGAVIASTNGGVAWAKVGDLPASAPDDLRISRADANRIYIACASAEKQQERLWVSNDGGATWTPISKSGQEGGLPDLPVLTIEEDRQNANVLFVGTFIGVYRSNDAGQSWARLGDNLPAVPVQTLAFSADGATLTAGTIGRGAWQIAASAGAAPIPAGGPLATITADFTVSPASPRPGRRVTFRSRTTGGVTAWSWDLGDGGTATGPVVEHVFAQPGTYAVRLTATGAGGASATKTAAVGVSYPTTGTGDALTYLIPVVLTAGGAGGAFFSTELTLTNRSARTLDLTFRTKGTFEASSTYALAPGQQVHPDVFQFLKTETGMSVPDGTLVTSLRIEVRPAAEIDIGRFGAQVRVTTPPNADLRAQGVIGRFGLSFPALPLGQNARTSAVVYGLQQTSSPGQPGTRSNVACVNAGGGSGRDITLEVSYTDGDRQRTHAQKDSMVLAPFEFKQVSQPLAARGIQSGWATVKKTAGDDQFVCYGVLNDNVNGDGAFVPMVATDAPSEVSDCVLPVVVDVAGYKSELTLANRMTEKVSGVFAVVPYGTADPEFGTFEIDPLAQASFPDIMEELRRVGFHTPPGTVASLYFYFEDSTAGNGMLEESPTFIPTSSVYLGARTYTTRAGGLFGLAYGYSPIGQGADLEAWVYGLQQSGAQGEEGGTRSNLALVHALGGDEANLQLEVTYFGPQGQELGKEPECNPCTLQPAQWKQINAPLARYGVSNGYARVRRVSGTDQFVAYGVLNDQGNSDGSYVAMSVP